MSPMIARARKKDYPALDRIERVAMHDEIYASLKTALMEARFEPGLALSLRELAGVFGVSVAPVRAALLRLVAEKAVAQSTTGNGGFYVPTLSEDEFEEIIRLRVTLEGAAAEQAATRITRQELSELKRLGVALEKATRDSDSDKYLRANRQFKFGVVQAARGTVLFDLVESLWIRFGPFMHYYGRDLPVHGKSDRYFEVVDALGAGDGKAARAHMEQDVLDGAKFLRKAAAESWSGSST